MLPACVCTAQGGLAPEPSVQRSLTRCHQVGFYSLVDSSGSTSPASGLAEARPDSVPRCDLLARRLAVGNPAAAIFAGMPFLFALASLSSALLVSPCAVVQVPHVVCAPFLLFRIALASSLAVLQPHASSLSQILDGIFLLLDGLLLVIASFEVLSIFAFLEFVVARVVRIHVSDLAS